MTMLKKLRDLWTDIKGAYKVDREYYWAAASIGICIGGVLCWFVGLF